MSDFLGNLAARSLGLAAVLRPLPRLYGAAPVEPAPDISAPAEDGSRPAPERRPAPPSRAEESSAPTALPNLGPPVPKAFAAAVTSESSFLPRPDAPRVAANAVAPGHAPGAPLPAYVPPASADSILPPLQLPAEQPSERATFEEPPPAFIVPQQRHTPLGKPGNAAPAPTPEVPIQTVVDQTVVVSLREDKSQPQATLQFRVPELSPTREAQHASPELARTPARRAAPPQHAAPPTEVAAPVSVTIGRLEIRVTPPAARPGTTAPTTPPVTSLEDYLRSRGRGGDA